MLRRASVVKAETDLHRLSWEALTDVEALIRATSQTGVYFIRYTPKASNNLMDVLVNYLQEYGYRVTKIDCWKDLELEIRWD